MVARPAPVVAPSSEAVEFVEFCYERRKVGWPELYDEMCGVARRGLFRGWGAEDLAENGIGLTLYEMPALAALVIEVVTEHRGRPQIRIAPSSDGA